MIPSSPDPGFAPPIPADPPSLAAWLWGGAGLVVILGTVLVLGALAMRRRNL